MIIAIDFDGTLHTGEWPSIGEPMPDAVDVMRRLKADGHYLIIWSCREGLEQAAMIDWLNEHGIPFDRVNDNRPDDIARYGGNSRKITADIYIDDRNLGGLPDWTDIYDMIRHGNIHRYSNVTYKDGVITMSCGFIPE
jgi:hypothetical protein